MHMEFKDAVKDGHSVLPVELLSDRANMSQHE